MKHHKTLTLAAILIALALALSPLATAQAQEAVFTETFDDATLPNWDRSEGAVVRDGLLEMATGSFAVLIGEYADPNFSVRVRRSGPGVIFIRYNLRQQTDYGLAIDEASITLEKSEGGGRQQLGSYAWQPITGEWFEIQVTVAAGEHTILLNGERILTANDAKPLPAGGIGFMVRGESSAAFDDLVVSAAGTR